MQHGPWVQSASMICSSSFDNLGCAISLYYTCLKYYYLNADFASIFYGAFFTVRLSELRRGRWYTSAFQIPVRPGAWIENARRRVFERFSTLSLSNQSLDSAQVFHRSVGHHMREEMHRVRQSF